MKVTKSGFYKNREGSIVHVEYDPGGHLQYCTFITTKSTTSREYQKQEKKYSFWKNSGSICYNIASEDFENDSKYKKDPWDIIKFLDPEEYPEEFL